MFSIFRVIVALILVTPVSAAQGQIPLGRELQINTYTTGQQSAPVVGPDGSGGFIVVWEDNWEDQGDLSGQRFSSGGFPLGDQFEITNTAPTSEITPRLSLDGSGGFVVTWVEVRRIEIDPDDPDYDYEILGQRFSSEGSRVGNAFQINTYTNGGQSDQSVSRDGTGGFVVVWRRGGLNGGYSPEYGIQARRFDSNGIPIADEFRIGSDSPGKKFSPRVASNGVEGFFVVWVNSGLSGDPVENRFLQGQRFDGEGSPIGGEFQISQPGVISRPAISFVGSGGFVVVWQGRREISGGNNVSGRRFDSIGFPAGSEFPVSENPFFSQGKPSVNSDGANGFIIAWESFGSLNSDSEFKSIQARRFASNGAAVGGDFQVNSYTTSYQGKPDIGLDGAGGFLILWNSYGSNGTDSSSDSIQAQRYFIGGTGGEPFTCLEDDQTLCLQGGRYEVKAYWRDYLGSTGQGQVVSGASSNSGLFYFFNQSNWEILVKILNGCSLNGHYWVFAAATTDVEYSLVIRDSITGESVFYHNELGTASPAITDTSAFATCP